MDENNVHSFASVHLFSKNKKNKIEKANKFQVDWIKNAHFVICQTYNIHASQEQSITTTAIIENVYS